MQVKVCRRSMYLGQGLVSQLKAWISCWYRSSSHWRRAAARCSQASWVSCTLSLTMSKGSSGRSTSSCTHHSAHASITVDRVFRTAALLRPSRSLRDLAEPNHLGPAIHVLAHLTSQGLEMLRSAMRLHSGLVGIARHEDVSMRCLRVMKSIEAAARLLGPHLGHQLLGHGLELLLHPRLHLDGRHDADHALTSSSGMALTWSRVLW